MTTIVDDITCRELVELVTDYLEGALEPADRARFEEHLVVCAACVTYVEQLRQTVRATGALREEAIEPAVREELLRAFRDWHRGHSPGPAP
ncbi:MAG TPA: zf-HC2 domain-containing protein [Solirubrobacteraceae bacterium]|nr:zf-HC2 domain-containing protein [Solirubrobacteraceae bacterium]